MAEQETSMNKNEVPLKRLPSHLSTEANAEVD